MKMLGLLLITRAGVWLGWSAAFGLKRRAAALDAMEKLIVRISSEIRYTAAPVREMLLTASRADEFHSLRFLGNVESAWKGEGDFPRAWEHAVDEEGSQCGFTAQDEALLREFGKGLGTSDTEGQTTHCQLYGELFARQAEEARREAANKGKLYMMLGLAGGLGLSLLLL